jgi:GT2 family glycosyltransferase
MLRSVQVQAVRPEQIIIVDGGEDRVDGVVDEFAGLNLEYIRVYPPSLSKQRNAGMERVHPSTTLAGYLDDDLVLEDGALESMLSFWEVAPEEVGGAAFNIVTDRRPHGTGFKSFFLLDDSQRGVVLRSGYQTMICPVEKTTYTQWLFGGATIWRSNVIDEFSYDEWYYGTGYGEDLDYSYRVGKKYKLAVVGDARVQHFSPPIRKEINFVLGKWQMINRMYFVKKNQDLSVPLCYWALSGQVLVNSAKALAKRDRALFMRVLGNILGMTRVVRGRLDRIGGIYK